MKRERSSSSSSSQLHDDPLTMMQLNMKITHHNHNQGSSCSNREKIRVTTTTKKILPQEIIDEILYRLPVKSLLRFKCVSKRWLSVLSDSTFNLYYKRKPRSVFAITLKGKIPSHYTIDDDNASSIKAFSLNVLPLILEEYNNNHHYWLKTVSNACNGLVLLRISKDSLALFNPSTRCYSLNALTLDFLDSRSASYYTEIGLCYDAGIDDYKALVIIYRVYNDHRVLVSCLKSKRWVDITDHVPFDVGLSIRGPLVNGHIHWTIGTTIAYFETTRNTFEALPSPPDQHKYLIIGLGVLDECLCIGRRSRNITEDEVEVVAMKKYGVAESWTTLYVLSILNVSSNFWNLCPLLLTKNGEEVLFMSNREEIWAYNPTSNSYRKFDMPDDIPDDKVLCATSVVQTIVSPAVVLDAEQ
ncbi:hypothetical protein LguiB_027551 [Lonicera macranthoides]